MNILVLEASTTSAKTMLYDTETGQSKVQTRVYHHCLDDNLTQSADGVVGDLIKLAKEFVIGTSVDMIAISGTWHSILLCDQKMNPVTNVYPWPNTSAAHICKRLRQDRSYIKWFYQRTGCMVNSIYPAFKVRLFREQGYNLENLYLMGQGSYLTYCLTGKRVTTACMASGSAFLNIQTKEYDPDVLKEIGVPIGNLPEIISYDRTYLLSKEGAQLLGLPEGIPVIPANSDGGLNQVGVGALKTGVMTFSVGTSGAMRLSVNEAKLPEDMSTWSYLSPKGYLSGAATSGCCNCIDWFATAHNVPYDVLERDEIREERVPIFLPFLFGERCPGWNDERRGGFCAVKDDSTIQEKYRAIQEGVLFNLYQCYKSLIELNGLPKKIKLSGGILKSEKWTQMCADIFGSEMEVDTQEQGSLLGGAVLAMEVAGIIENVEEFDVDAVEIIKPNAKNRERYMEKYNAYLDWYNKDELSKTIQ